MRALLMIALSLFAGSAFADHQCQFTAERKLDIDPAGLRTLALNLHSSDLRATGVDGIKQIEVRGKACASEEAWLADLDLEQARTGDSVTVSPKRPNRSSSFNVTGSTYAYIDIEVRLPKNLLVQVDSGSGDVDVSDIAAITFDTGSGDMRIDHVAGAVTVKVGSGDVIADDIGSLIVERSGSGDMHATHVRGEVKVGNVGSGDLTFRDVRSNVNVDSIGSGDLVADNVGGDVSVGSVGSGDITVDSVAGAFTVGHAGSGDIHHHNVTGKIAVPKRHGDD
jgi:DUF4097 and DUF4098 domain-containing protein YvlB